MKRSLAIFFPPQLHILRTMLSIALPTKAFLAAAVLGAHTVIAQSRSYIPRQLRSDPILIYHSLSRSSR